jgi:hypothetical protein
MSHAVFHTAQIMPIKTLSSKPKVGPFFPVVHPVADKMCRRGLVLKASAESSSALVGGDSVGLLERCFVAPPASGASDLASAVMVAPVMKGQYGAFGAVTLEKGKLDMSQKQSQSSPEVCSSFILIFFFSVEKCKLEFFICCLVAEKLGKLKKVNDFRSLALT